MSQDVLDNFTLDSWLLDEGDPGLECWAINCEISLAVSLGVANLSVGTDETGECLSEIVVLESIVGSGLDITEDGLDLGNACFEVVDLELLENSIGESKTHLSKADFDTSALAGAELVCWGCVAERERC